jgi:hypothetical protein
MVYCQYWNNSFKLIKEMSIISSGTRSWISNMYQENLDCKFLYTSSKKSISHLRLKKSIRLFSVWKFVHKNSQVIHGSIWLKPFHNNRIIPFLLFKTGWKLCNWMVSSIMLWKAYMWNLSYRRYTTRSN